MCSSMFSPISSTVQIYDPAGLQVLRDLRLPRILLYIHRADPRLAKVSSSAPGVELRVAALAVAHIGEKVIFEQQFL